MASKAARYDLIREYQASLKDDLNGVSDQNYISLSPAWLIAVIRLGKPVSFSRREYKSVGDVKEGAFTRNDIPLLIDEDCVQLSITNSKGSHTKNLNATLKNSGTNYLNQDVLLPGDWVMAWMFNNKEDLDRIKQQVLARKPCNGFADGLKFVGRAHSIRKHISVSAEGQRDSGFSLQCTGFEELDSCFFYDMALATSAGVSNEISLFMAQLGLDFSKWANQEEQAAGVLKDNADRLIETMIDTIVGKGVSAEVNAPIEEGAARAHALDSSATSGFSELKIAPQANKEAPYAYLVPRDVGSLLGLSTIEATKSGIYGYSDILETLIGVQKYDPSVNNASGIFVPALFYPEVIGTQSRRRTDIKLKGTFLPVNPSFVNRPLWTLLQQFLNDSINEMYTALKVNPDGAVVPTVVVRQIPFTTESLVERPEFPVTRFMELPRWVVATTMIWNIDVGRSNATRANMIHVYGEASTSGASIGDVTSQMVRNPPIFDSTDIQRSGIHAMMKTVNCSLEDSLRKDGARIWMEAIADWTFGSHLTLNGSVSMVGVQSPIAEGDNCEIDGMVYHIEEVAHTCSVAPGGQKQFRTTLHLSNGMPAEQDGATVDFPVYPGFQNAGVIQGKKKHTVNVEHDTGQGFSWTEQTQTESTEDVDTKTVGDDSILESQDPGFTSSR